MKKLGDLSIADFLANYWQKKPVLIRNAFAGFTSPVEPDEIAGLSLEEDVESRIILEDGPNHKWELLNGPFDESTFANLPKEKWTLLIQGADHWVPELADILALFDFVPSWRRDDLMVSFAPKGGSVGPHYDNYDVFLIQAQGQRKWQVGPKCNANTQTLDETPLRILSEMTVDEEWVLNPGDMLYLPPLYAHNGVAQNDCMTFSIGFRAPSRADVLRSYTDYAGLDLAEEDRYSDSDLQDCSAQPALINEDAVTRVQDMLLAAANDREQIKCWLATYMTEAKYPELFEELEEPLEWDELAPALEEATHIVTNEMARLAYFHDEGETLLFANGELLEGYQAEAAQLIETIANQRHTQLDDLAHLLAADAAQQALIDLFNANLVYLDELEAE